MMILVWGGLGTEARAFHPARYLGSGTPNIEIRTPAGLIDIMDPANKADWSATIQLKASLDMSGITIRKGDPDPTPGNTDTPPVIQGSQIGNNADPFTGLFKGNRFVIKNLTIVGDGDQGTTPDTADGLFGVVQRTAANLTVPPNYAVQEVILLSPAITGFAADVGCLVGRLEQGTVYRCCIFGPGGIVASGNQVNLAVGGLVGQIRKGDTLSNALGDLPTVSECFVTCSVTGPTDVGGLVGRMNGPNAFITNSFAVKHRVIGIGTPVGNECNLGGLVGLNNRGGISCCYADCITPLAPDPSLATPATAIHVGALVGQWLWAPAAMISNYCDKADDTTDPKEQAIGTGDAPDFAAIAVTQGDLEIPATYTQFPPGWPWGTVWTLPGPGLTPRLLWRPF